MGLDTAIREGDERADARTNMFIAATMRGESGSSPIKIRNMSPRGALIETSFAPDVGSSIMLKRGSLEVAGTIVWSAESRCGVRLMSAVNTRDWMAPPSNTGQAVVDRQIAQLRAGGATLQLVQQTASSDAAEIITRLSRVLDDLADALADDPLVVERHGQALQSLDRAAQDLQRLRRRV